MIYFSLGTAGPLGPKECAQFSFDGEECRPKLIGVAAGGGGALVLLIIITALIIRHRRAGTNL